MRKFKKIDKIGGILGIVILASLLPTGGSSEFQITFDPKGQGYPAIYRNIVVWEDHRNGNEDIYGYNLSTGEEFQITANENCQEDPAIYGDIVV